MQDVLFGLLLLIAGNGIAADAEHQRGDFSFQVGSEPGFVVRHDVPSAWTASAPGADEARWRYWLYDVQADRRDGRDEVYVEHVYEPRSTALLGEAGRFQVGFNPAYQRLTLHRVELRRDGRWSNRLDAEKVSLARRESGFEQDLADGIVTALIVLDDVRVGDAVRVSYSVQGSNPVLAGQISDWMRFGWQSPVLDARLRVLFDPGARPKVHAEHAAPKPVVQQRADAVELVMHARESAPVVDEQSYPAWYQPYPTAQVAKERSWRDVVAWALPLYPSVDALAPDLEEKVRAWSKLADPFARVNAALRMVQDEVRYFGVEMGENTHRPAAPAETWRRRYGDCKDKTYLLATLLGRLGIQAVPALVSSGRGRAILDFVPSASVFDHVVVRAQVEGLTLWLDPTVTQQGGDPRDSDLSHFGAALAVAPGVRELETIGPGRSANEGVRIVERYDPGTDGRDVSLGIETIYRGLPADRARRSIGQQRREDLSRGYADHYRRRFGELEVLALPDVEDDRKDNTFRVVESYRLKAPFESEGAIRVLDVYADALRPVATLPSTMARSGPLDFARPGEYRHEVEVMLPPNWKAGFRNEALDHSSSAFDYRREVSLGEESVALVYAITVMEADVAPDKVAHHLGELRRMNDSLSARLRFQIPSAIAAEERERRLRGLLRNVMNNEGDK